MLAPWSCLTMFNTVHRHEPIRIDSGPIKGTDPGTVLPKSTKMCNVAELQGCPRAAKGVLKADHSGILKLQTVYERISTF